MDDGQLVCYPRTGTCSLRGSVILTFTPCLEKYNQSEARITVAYSAVCNGNNG